MADEAVTEAAPESTVAVETEKDSSSAAPQEMDLETLNADATNGGKREREEEANNESSENGNEAKKTKVEEEEKAMEEQVPEKDSSSAAPQEMDLETLNADATNGGKREREEEANNESSENGNEAKKAKVEEEEKAVEEQVPEKEAEKSGPVTVGYKTFETSEKLFEYFFKFLHFWPPNLNVNKYEHTMLLELLKKGHLEPEKKIGTGIHAFQVRYHPQWKSRCFFLVREDDSADDFSFRKCVDHILPLPENMQIKSDVNKALGGGHGGRGGGGGGRGGGRGNWRGRGRGGKSRN